MHTVVKWAAWMLLATACASWGVAASSSGQDRALEAGSDLIGTPAPRMTLKTIDGQDIDLGALYGKKAVYLKFWATWCTPCREQMPHFQQVYEGAGSDLAVIAVDVGFNDSLAEILKYRERLHITMPIVIDDGRLAAAFHLRVTPQHIVIGRDGRIAYVGHLADARLNAALEAARTAPTMAAAAQTAAASRAKPASVQPALQVGDAVPPLEARTLDGNSVRLAGGGQAVALLFLSPWCESYLATTRPAVSANCRNAREEVATLGGVGHVHWLGVASGLWATRDDLRAYQAEHKIAIPLTLDASGALFRRFGVSNTPTIILVGADGRIVRRVDPEQLGSLRQAVASL
jgi:peroxiredoxin